MTPSVHSVYEWIHQVQYLNLVCVCAESLSHVQLFVQSARLLCPWKLPGKTTGMGSHLYLQGIFLTQGLTCVIFVSCIGRWILCHSCCLESPELSTSLHSFKSFLSKYMLVFMSRSWAYFVGFIPNYVISWYFK